MSRKMVVAAVAAAGVVGFGSAAVATVNPLGIGEVKDQLPSASSVGDRVSEGLESQNVNIPAPADLGSALENLRSELNGGGLSLDTQNAQVSGERVAVAVENLADKVRAGSAKLNAAQVGGAEKLATQLETAAAKLRSASFDNLGGSSNASGEVSASSEGGSVSGSGQTSGAGAGGSVSGGASLSGTEALQQLRAALSRVQQMDQSNALSAGANDVLDSEKAEAAIERVTTRLNGLLG